MTAEPGAPLSDEPTRPTEAGDRDPPSGASMIPPDPLLGVVLEERYEILRLLMAGGMGATYLARDVKLGGKEVVVKVPDAKLLRDREFRQRWRREVQHLIELEHKHVVNVLDAGIHERQPYVVLQYVRGGDLKHRLKPSSDEPRPSTRLLVDWLRSIARALDFLHRQGTVHRDVKPENLLIDGEDAIYLADFGIAKAVEHADRTLTETGITPGTPQYMAPEQAEGGTLTGKTDQYALAVTAYEALSGRLPHEGDTPLTIIMGKLRDAPRPLDDLSDRIPPAAAAALVKALARDPAERFESCTAFVSALARGFGFETSPTDVSPTLATAPVPEAPAVTQPGERAARRRGPWIAAGLVALVLAGLLISRPWSADAPPPRRPLEPNIARGGSLDADEGSLRRYLEELTDEGWDGRGTPRARAAIARWLAGWCGAMGLEHVPGQRSYIASAMRDGSALHNIYAWLPGAETATEGPRPYVLFVTHFDGLGIKDGVRHPSADNNGSGVAALLELVRLLIEHRDQVQPTKHAVLFALLDRHQDNIAGARELAEHAPLPLKDCIATIGVEQLGRSLLDLVPGSLLVIGGENAPELLKVVDRHPVEEGGILMPVGRDLYHGIPDVEPFRRRKVPSLFVMAGPSLDFGNPADTVDRIDFPWLKRRTDWLRNLVIELANVDKAPAWIDQPKPRLAEVEAVRKAIGIAEENARTVHEIPEASRTMLKNFTRTLDRIIERGAVTDAERRALVNVARMMWGTSGVWRKNEAGLHRSRPREPGK